MPENEPVLGAPAPRSPSERVGAVADALGTTPLRLVLGAAAGIALAAAVAWTLLATPTAGSASSVDSSLPRAAAPASSPSSTAVPTRALVYVTGAVASPGVYRLPDDARVADALSAAGGPGAEADLTVLNLAAPVSDGERVYVPRKGEAPPPDSAPPGGGSAGPLNLNTATVEQLEALPGIGPSTAEAIAAWRRRHGRFKRVDDLLNVRGIGPAKLDALRNQVRV